MSEWMNEIIKELESMVYSTIKSSRRHTNDHSNGKK